MSEYKPKRGKTVCLWQTVIKDYEVAVYRMPDGQFMGSMGLKQILDSHGTSLKQELFQTEKDAFRYVGFPVDFLPLPTEAQQ